MNKKSRGAIVVGVEQWREGVAINGVEQLGGTIAIDDDEWCFLVMLRLEDFQWSCNFRCDPKFNAILHVEMIIFESNIF
jgi:hypothetical protein